MRRAFQALLFSLTLLHPNAGARAQCAEANGATAVSDAVRGELFAARERVWRAFFTEEPERLAELLGPELIAIQQHQENWERRDALLAMGRAIRRGAVRIERLEFPRTDIQLFGDVAILYFTYVFGTAGANWAVTHSGRGTEVFVRRQGRWVDVGWHLDQGAFVRRGDSWQRVGGPTP